MLPFTKAQFGGPIFHPQLFFQGTLFGWFLKGNQKQTNQFWGSPLKKCVGQSSTTIKTAGSVLVSMYQAQFGVPVFDPQRHGAFGVGDMGKTRLSHDRVG